MRTANPFAVLLIASMFAVALTGCPASTPPGPAAGGGDGHEGHEHDHSAPTSLVDAYEKIEHMSEDIKVAFEAGTPKEAHDALHDVGMAIDALPKLGEEAGIEAKEDLERVKSDLMQSFMKLDGVLHNQDEVAWGDVSETIESAMEKLHAMLPEHEHADHGDDHADEDGHADHDGEEHAEEEHAAHE